MYKESHITKKKINYDIASMKKLYKHNAENSWSYQLAH